MRVWHCFDEVTLKEEISWIALQSATSALPFFRFVAEAKCGVPLQITAVELRGLASADQCEQFGSTPVTQSTCD